MASRPTRKRGPYGQWKIDETAEIPRSTRKSMQKAKAVPPASDCNDSLEHLASYDRSECDDRAQPPTDHEEYSQADTEKSFGEKLYPGSQITVMESVLLLLNLNIKHNLTSSTICDIIDIVRLHTPKEASMVSKHLDSLYFLKKSFGINAGAGTKLHHICENCKYLYEDEDLGACPVEGCGYDRFYSDSRTPRAFFIEVDVEEQIRQLFEDEEHLQDIRRVEQRDDTNICDVYDGELFKTLAQDAAFKASPNNITLTWHLDGASVFKSSDVSIWPLQAVVNELPPYKRFKKDNVLLLGLWFGKGKPCLTSYFQPVAEKMNTLRDTGLVVHPFQETPSTCRVHLLAGTMDLPAMSMTRHMHQFNGEYGCGMCEVRGISVPSGRGHCRTFQPSEQGPIRTRESVIQCAEEASNSGKPVKGIKGFSSLLMFHGVDPVKQILVDYLHGVCLGVVKNLFTFWFDKSHRGSSFWIGDRLDEIDGALLAIQPTDEVTRPPRSIQKERSHFKASEYRNFLLLYGPHVLRDILPEDYYLHFLMLCRGVGILMGDCITPADLDEASRLLLQFYCLYGSYYEQRGWTLNTHNVGMHLVDCVRMGGPLWAFGCFGFESFCGEYVRMIHGTQHIALQIISAFRAIRHLRASVKMAFLSPDIGDVLLGKKRILEEYGGSSRVSALKKVSNTEISSLVMDHTTRPAEVHQFGKLTIGHTTVVGTSHSNSRKRSNAAVQLLGVEDNPCFAEVDTFLRVSRPGEPPEVFAVVRYLHITEGCPFTQHISETAMQEHNLHTGVFADQAKIVRIDSHRSVIRLGHQRVRKVLLLKTGNPQNAILIKFPNEYEHD